MLVMTRVTGQSIFIGTEYSVTVKSIFPNKRYAVLDICSINADTANVEVYEVNLAFREKALVGPAIEIHLVDVERNKIRLGIVAPRSTWIYREPPQSNPKPKDDDFGSGDCGTRVPRPSKPKPPNLNVQLEEPKTDEE